METVEDTKGLLEILVNRGCKVIQGHPDLTPVQTYGKGLTCHSTILHSDKTVYKACSKCKKWVDYFGFSKDSGTKSLITFSCKPCAASVSRKNHAKRAKDPTWVAERRRKMNATTKANKEKAIEYKGGRCNDCRQKYPSYVYDFHHVDSREKEDNPSYFLKKVWEEAIVELDKCVLLCANCHRERHFG